MSIMNDKLAAARNELHAWLFALEEKSGLTRNELNYLLAREMAEFAVDAVSLERRVKKEEKS